MDRDAKALLFDENGEAVTDPPVIERVDPKTGLLIKIRGYTSAELKLRLQQAPIGVGREPVMLGVRTGALPDDAKALVRKRVYEIGPTPHFLMKLG